MSSRLSIIVLAIAAAAIIPFFVGGYEVGLLLTALFYVLLATGLNLVSGYAGQFSFAQAAFYGIGAYTAAIMSRDLGTSFWINLPAGIVITGMFGLLLGIPALRLKGHFLAIVTIAFQTIIYLVLIQWMSFTGGQVGVSVPGIGKVSLFGVELFEIVTVQSYYWLTLALTVVGMLIAWRLLRSRLGREWIAIRDDETLASAIGLRATWIKLTAFVASAAFAGAAGVVTAHYMRGVTPDDFNIWISCMVVAMMVVGGRGTFFGPLLGALLLTIMPELMGSVAQYKMLLSGLVLVIAITVMPDGIVGRILRWRGQ
ncbi:MAG TPA: branched-chain amino acid ABC transporter permease [Burkholderiaceae bacterium]|nr:branched-chain amino acid ABC transporter permease [Burkholderiaceae bacterium]